MDSGAPGTRQHGHQRLLGVVAAAVLLVMLIGAGTGTLPPVLDATPAATGIFATCVAAVYCCPWRPRQRRSRPFPWRRAVDEGSDEDVPPRRMRRKAAVKANREALRSCLDQPEAAPSWRYGLPGGSTDA